MAKDVGSGETTYSNYDKKIADDARTGLIIGKQVINLGFSLFHLYVLIFL